jgi:hypothetical protein
MGRDHWLTSVSDKPDMTAESFIRTLLDSGWYLFGEHTGGRKDIKPEDKICFYLKGHGVVAEATVLSRAESPVPDPLRKHSYGKYGWAFRVGMPRYFFRNAIKIDPEMRGKLDAFGGRDLSNAKSWVWFVQGTHKITENDFTLLTAPQQNRRP